LHCADGEDECNIMETEVMSLVEKLDLFVSRSACLCCVVLCCVVCVCVLFGVAGLIARFLKVQMNVTLWRLGSFHKCRLWAFLCLDQCVCAIRAVEVPVLFWLRSKCHYMAGVGGPWSLLEEH